MLEMIKFDKAKLEKIQNLLQEITDEFEETINVGETAEPSLFEQRSALLEIQAILEDLQELAVRLEGSKRKLENLAR